MQSTVWGRGWGSPSGGSILGRLRNPRRGSCRRFWGCLRGIIRVACTCRLRGSALLGRSRPSRGFTIRWRLGILRRIGSSGRLGSGSSTLGVVCWLRLCTSHACIRALL